MFLAPFVPHVGHLYFLNSGQLLVQKHLGFHFSRSFLHIFAGFEDKPFFLPFFALFALFSLFCAFRPFSLPASFPASPPLLCPLLPASLPASPRFSPLLPASLPASPRFFPRFFPASFPDFPFFHVFEQLFHFLSSFSLFRAIFPFFLSFPHFSCFSLFSSLFSDLGCDCFLELQEHKCTSKFRFFSLKNAFGWKV